MAKNRRHRVNREPIIQPQDQSVRYIPLTMGKFAIVDAADYEWLNQWNWCTFFDPKRNSYYAERRNGNKRQFMHRLIAGEEHRHVDHKNNNGLDNRRDNVRGCTISQNFANRAPQKNNRSGYKGIYPNGNNWGAKIKVNGENIYLGTRKTKEESARLYDTAAIRYFGEFAQLNFPLKTEEAGAIDPDPTDTHESKTIKVD
jgi:hypothetical protein